VAREAGGGGACADCVRGNVTDGLPRSTIPQRWAFVVITEVQARRQLGEIYRCLGERFIRDTDFVGVACPSPRLHPRPSDRSLTIHRVTKTVNFSRYQQAISAQNPQIRSW
jgi:hypothetical protein